jgi:hypothetical protein
MLMRLFMRFALCASLDVVNDSLKESQLLCSYVQYVAP